MRSPYLLHFNRTCCASHPRIAKRWRWLYEKSYFLSTAWNSNERIQNVHYRIQIMYFLLKINRNLTRLNFSTNLNSFVRWIVAKNSNDKFQIITSTRQSSNQYLMSNAMCIRFRTSTRVKTVKSYSVVSWIVTNEKSSIYHLKLYQHRFNEQFMCEIGYVRACVRGKKLARTLT